MKNEFIVIDENTIAIIIVFKGHKFNCYIDKEDLPKVSQIRGTWHINRNRTGHVDGVRTKVQENNVRKQVWLHNLVFNKVVSDNVVDHIDHNPLNNRKPNLREVTPKENAQNITIQLSNSKTCYRNITIERGKYRVRINGKSFGNFNSFEEAKIVADKERTKIFPITSKENGKVFINNE